MNIYCLCTTICFAMAATVPASHATLLAYYNFENDLLDKSGSGVHPTSSAGVTYTASGYIGGAYNFSGTGSFVQIPLDINPTAHPQLTMGAWVRPSSATAIKTVISHDNGSFDRTIGIDFRGTGGTGWSAFAGTQSVLGGSFPVTADEWVFLAAVYDQTAASTRLYVNGASVSIGSSTLGAGNTFTQIGRNPGFGELFQGTIDEVFFYSSALSDSDLDDIRINGITIPEPTTFPLLVGMASVLFAARRKK